MYGFRAYGGPEVEELLDVPVPVTPPDGLLVRVRAAGVNPADIKVRQGLRRDTVDVVFPMAMGREAAGTVVGVGAETDGFRRGDEVFGATASGTGAFCEYALLAPDATAHRPPLVSPEQASVLPVAYGTALDAIAALGLGPGDRLLLIGAGGGVGTAVCQLARDLGIHVVGVASPGKTDHVHRAGGVPIASGPGWEARVTASGAPAGALLDTVGGDVLTAASGLIRPGAPLASLADPAEGTRMGGLRIRRRRDSTIFADLARRVAEARISPVITARHDLRDAAAAITAVGSGHAVGKTVILPNG